MAARAFITGVGGLALSRDERAFLADAKPFGFILFKRNVSTKDQVRELAQRLAQRVKRTGEAYTLDPMHAYERRVIHMTLADDPGVTTESTGKEPARRVIINPTGPAQGGPPERYEGARQGRSSGRPY